MKEYTAYAVLKVVRVIDSVVCWNNEVCAVADISQQMHLCFFRHVSQQDDIKPLETRLLIYNQVDKEILSASSCAGRAGRVVCWGVCDLFQIPIDAAVWVVTNNIDRDDGLES